jgi:hypothetical protein
MESTLQKPSRLTSALAFESLRLDADDNTVLPDEGEFGPGRCGVRHTGSPRNCATAVMTPRISASPFRRPMVE